MKKRGFSKTVNALRTRNWKALDPAKIAALGDAEKDEMVRFIVRQRGPVLVSFLTEGMDRSWLAACGYLHRTTGETSGLTFLHTAETAIR